MKREIDEELRFHIEQSTAANIEAGMMPEEAARAARKRFGNLQTVREECRRVRGASLGEELLQDLRYGARGLWNSRGFTLVAVVSLALGIGATTTVFSLASAVLLRPLPVEEPDSLMSVHRLEPEGSRIHVISYPDYLDYRSRTDVFSDLLAWCEAPLSLELDGRAEEAYGMLVSGNYFSTLGIQPAVGRFFDAEEDRTPGADPVAVLSFALWQSRFGGDPSVVGKDLELNGHAFTVVGVAPRGFTSTYSVFAPALYVPLMMQAQILARADAFESRLSRNLKLTGRLAPGVSRDRAEAALSVLDHQLEAAQPQPEDTAPSAGLELVPVGSFPEDVRLAVLGAAGLLMAIVGFVLLIACANVAGMLLARATVRQHEIAVRLALGATRRRLIRQLLTESSLLFLVAGALGVGLAAGLTRVLSSLTLPISVPFALEPRLDGRVLCFTLGLALSTGILFGLAPALEAARSDLQAAMKDAPRGTRRSRLRQVFVVAQIALALVLLIGAGLVTRALRYARTIHPGRDPESVLTAGLDPRPLGYDVARARELYRGLSERVAALPGVESVSFVRHLDVGAGYSKTSLIVEEAPHEGDIQPECGIIAPGYFQTLGITLLEGRDFSPADREGTPPVVIVNQALARHFWHGASALGKRVGAGEGAWSEIIGVVEDGRHRVAGQAQPPFVYWPFLQSQSDNLDMTLVWRQRGDVAGALAAVRGEVQALDPDLALRAPMTLSDAVRMATLPWRVAGMLANGFGLVGLALAVLGIYGLVSYTFARRTQEIGVRMALGARRREVFELVMAQGLKLALVGVGVGVALALGLTRALTALLFGVSASDPVTYLCVAALLVLVTLVACWLPARRAARVDPMAALRHE